MGNPTTQDWVRLDVLILQRACNLLRKQFLRRWKLTQSSEWVDSPEFGFAFISGPASQIYKSVGRLHKMTLAEGDVHSWDFSLLTKILQQVDFLKKSENDHQNQANLRQEFASENEKISELISYSKQAFEYPAKTMEDFEFSRLWDKIESILVSFGENEKELEQLKRTESVSEDDLASILGGISDVDQNCVAEARKLKEDAKNLMNSGDLEGAIGVLTGAVGGMGKVLPAGDLGALYAMRSDAYLKQAVTKGGKEERMEGAYVALKDAKQAMFLRPAWGLAHYRVGMAYVELGKYKKASKYLDQALDLEPNEEEIRVANSTCKIKLVQLSDDFAPELKTFQKVNFLPKPRPLPGGTRYSPEVMDQLDTIFFPEDDDNILGDVYKAHKFRDGINTKQSYKDAAILYRKGVRSRNAECMYNLALLKLEGNGIKQDVKGAIDLLKRAAKQPTKLCKGSGYNFVSNVGVIEAAFVLGLLAAEGIAFPPQKDLHSAAVWYQESSQHGSGPAAHNLALLYSKGHGVPLSEKRAVQLWKLAASRKVPEAMFGLAIHHAKEWETAEARKWFELAINELPCKFHAFQEEESDDLETCWTPTSTLINEFSTVLDTIDYWRVRYGQKEIARWEVLSGEKAANQNLSVKTRLARMLRDVDAEKEKIFAIEAYFQTDLASPPVHIPFQNAKSWAARVRQGMLLNQSEGEDSSRENSQSRSVSRTSSGGSSEEPESVGSVSA